jgi:hypothetical protein
MLPQRTQDELVQLMLLLRVRMLPSVLKAGLHCMWDAGDLYVALCSYCRLALHVYCLPDSDSALSLPYQ